MDSYLSAGVIFTDLLYQPEDRVGFEFLSYLNVIHNRLSRAERPPAATGLNSWENHTCAR